MGFGQLWKVMEIKNTIFQYMESFGKEKGFSKWPWKSCGFLFAKVVKISHNGYSLVSY